MGEDRIYGWDYLGYWNTYKQYGRLLADGHFRAWLHALLASVRTEDYNALPVSPFMPLYMQWGGAREIYISAIAAIYLVPCCALLAFISTKDGGVERPGWYRFGVVFLFALLYVPFWRPTLRGYPDIGGGVFLLAACAVGLLSDFSKRLNWRRGILVGLFLFLAFAMRRWYAFAVVSTVVSLSVVWLLDSPERDFRAMFHTALNAALVCLAVGVLVLIFEYELILRVIHTDYGDIYSAYRLPFIESLRSILNSTGLWLLPLFVAGLASLVQSGGKRRLVLFAVANFAITLYLFTRTQTPGYHHQLPMQFWLFIVMAVGLLSIMDLLQRRLGVVERLVSCVMLGALLLVFLSTVFRGWGGDLAWPGVLPVKNYSLRLQNRQGYQKFVSALETDCGGQIAVFSSSQVLNPSMLGTFAGEPVESRLAPVSHVDLRDGFSFQSLMAECAVSTDPVQTHLVEGGQRVIEVPNLLIQRGETPYLKRESFDLDDGVMATIYTRNRAFSYDEATHLLNALLDFYPSWRERYDLGAVMLGLTSDVSKSGKWGAFELLDGEIFVHPGEEQPTVFAAPSAPGVMTFHSTNTTCAAADGVRVNINSSLGEFHRDFILANGASRVMDLHDIAGQPFSVSIGKNGTPDCDGTSISTRP